nr:hypothetical protein [Tanacetum cinerariifolium]
MEAGTTATTLTAKLPILKTREYDLWLMRIEQYFLMTDYSHWEVIKNGNKVLKKTIGTVKQIYKPTSVEEKIDRKNEMKARGTLLMALPNKDQLKFHSYQDAKLLMEAIEKRYGGNMESKKVQRTLLKQQYENFAASSSKTLDQTFDRLQKLISQLEIQGEVIEQEDINLKLLRNLPSECKTHALIWRNKAEIETISLDDLYNNLKIYEPKLTGSSSTSQNPQNVAFVSSNSTNNTNSTNEADNTAYRISTAHTHGNTVNSTSVDNLSDVVICAFLTIILTIRARRFIKRTGRNLDINGQKIGFDGSKVKCFNCYKNGHFARECRAPKNQENRGREYGRKNMPVENPTENALIAQDGIGGSDSEVDSRSKTCLKAYATFKEKYNSLSSDYKTSQFNLVSYKAGLQSVEERLVHYKINEAVFKEKISILNLEVRLRDNALVEYIKKLEKAEKERHELKLTVGKYQNSSKSLNTLLESQVSDKVKTGLGYKASSPAVEYFVNSSKMIENEENVKSRLDKGYHAVPLPYTVNYIPPKPDLMFIYEQVESESVDVVSNVSSSAVKTVESKVESIDVKNKGVYSTVETKPIKKNSFSPPIIKDLISNDESEGNPQQKEYKEKEVIDSGCSMHITGNKCYLTDYEDYDGGFVSFRDGKGRISRKGTACLLNDTIFEELARMGSTMASAIICLANNQKFNFSKYIFDNMVKHLEGRVTFLMFLRFLQVFMDKQVEGMAKHKEIYVISSHTKKVFANIRRQGQGFFGNVTFLFETMMVNAQEEVGLHTISHHIPTDTQPSSSKPQKKIKPKRKQRQATKVHSPNSEIPVEESIPTPSNDPLHSGEDSLQLNELMIFYTNLQQQVLKLEEAKTAQAKEIANLKKIVKKLEKRRKSRPAGLRRLKKERSVEDIDQDAKIALVDEAQGRMHDADMFGVDDLEGNEVIVDVKEKIIEKEVSTADPVTIAGEVVIAASVEDSVAPTTTTTANIDDELTLEKTLIAIKAAKLKVILTAATIVTTITTPRAKAEMEEEERIAREKDEANRAVIEEWDDVQATINVDRQLAKQIQEKEKEQLSIEERSKLLAKIIESKRKYFAAKRAKEIKNKPPTKTQQKSLMYTYMKNIEGFKQKDFKGKSFNDIKIMFDKVYKRVNTFMDMNTENVEESLKKTQAKVTKGNSKRAGQELEQEKIVLENDDDVAIEATPISSKSPTIVDCKIYKEGKKNYFKIIKADGNSQNYLTFGIMFKNFNRET